VPTGIAATDPCQQAGDTYLSPHENDRRLPTPDPGEGHFDRGASPVTRIATLSSRAVIAVSGEDRVSFLQGLVSNDVADAAPGRAVWTGLLTPQGKWLADFFVFADGDRLLLDCERAQRPMLIPRLSRYRLRARVTLTELDLTVQAVWDGTPDQAGLAAPDPRLEGAGWRVLTGTPAAPNATKADWDRFRLSLGLPDGSRDMEAEKSVLLEGGFDELNGVSWTKGCYMGQELTARTKYRGLLKRRLVPVRIDGTAPAPGTPLLAEGRDVGTMRSAAGEIGMAVVRLDAMDQVLTADGARVTPVVPAWMRMTEV
jgi:tRNA-modifying protein YgfZ